MTPAQFVILPRRGILSLGGEDRCTFLQGMISNDITRVTSTQAIYAGFLTPQGRFLHDLFIAEIGNTLAIDGEAERLSDLETRLSRYRLRAKVSFKRDTDQTVAIAFGDSVADIFHLPATPGTAGPLDDGNDTVACVDPRLPEAGVRVVLPMARATERLAALGLVPGSEADYDRHRLSLGLPDGSRDMAIDKALLLENGFEELNGVDFKKGCYLGQEMTARTRYRGLVRKRLVPVSVDGPLPAIGTPVLCGDTEAGEMRSGLGCQALALIRLEYLLDSQELTTQGARVSVRIPAWMSLPSQPDQVISRETTSVTTKPSSGR